MVTYLQLKKVIPDELCLRILPVATRRALLEVAKLAFLPTNKWYLAGGTALCLQVGHRQSVDLDFFTPQNEFDDLKMERQLLKTGQWQTTFREKGTMYGVLHQAKVSFIAYPFFQPSPKRLVLGKIALLLSNDIAAMKIIAISQRGRKRDFFDLYWYCQNCQPLDRVLMIAMHQYPGQEENLHHIIKSLVYFKDAENDPAPKIYFKATWNQVKKYFRSAVSQIVRNYYLK